MWRNHKSYTPLYKSNHHGNTITYSVKLIMVTDWTHLIRFKAKEDGQEHFGQLVDTTRDVGIDSLDGKKISAYKIEGTMYDGVITGQMLTVDTLLSPVPVAECNYIRCVGLNYKDHAAEGGFDIPKVPVLFSKPRTALIGPYPTPVTIPKCAQDGTSDYEAELCVVIGKSGKDIPEEYALDHVLGYTSSNDISARKLQFQTNQWCYSKGLDASCPIGPVMVSPKVIEDPQNLSIKAIYNGNIVQSSNTSNMVFDVKKLVSFFSMGTTLEAGSIILTGTPAGIGIFRDPKVILQDGGDIRVEIDKIGTLVSKIKYE